MASEYQLRLLYKAEFHDVYAEHCEHPEFSKLLQRMKVVDSEGESQMDEDQWEAASTFPYNLIDHFGKLTTLFFFPSSFFPL